jgi:tRNA(Ile2) C34 agmatinyltransferase TiaS
MEYFLICSNPKCRYLINLREGAQVLERSKLVLDECPECGHQWSSVCPFCGHSLQTDLREIPHRCARCARALVAENPQTR